MTTDLAFTRVVIACDAVGEHRTTIEAAARFAARLGAPLRGIFIEDEALLHLAAFPFVRTIGATGQSPEMLSERAILHQFEAHAARLRSALARSAAAEDLSWSFDVLRGPSNIVAGALSDRDLLVIETKSRPFAGTLQLDSRLLSAAFKTDRPLLLLRDGTRSMAEIVALVQTPAAAARNLITTAAKLAATVGRPLRLLLLPGTLDVALALELVTAVSADLAHRCRIEEMPARANALSEKASPGRLLVLDGALTVTSEAALQQILAATRADLLVLR